MKFKKSVGQREKVPIREAFPHEAHDFTVWLAENMDALADDIGLQLVFVEREKTIGELRVDLLCQDNHGNRVVIENQLEVCDDDHFTRLLRYMTRLRANTAIWITPDSSHKHRELVQGLNTNAKRGVRYYLVRVEAFRIDGSRPYPFFTVQVRPSEDDEYMEDSPEVVIAETEVNLSKPEPESYVQVPKIDLPTVWCIYPRRDEETYSLFMRDKIIGLGFGDLGDLRKLESTPDAFRKLWEKNRPDLSKRQISTLYPMFFSLVCRASVGDLVIYPPTWKERVVHAGRITGDYQYIRRRSQGYPDRRPVEWIASFLRESFSVSALMRIAVNLAFFQVRNETFLSELAVKLSENGAK